VYQKPTREKKKPTLQEAAWHDSKSSADHTSYSKMATAAGTNVSTPILKLLSFSGNKETKEYTGTKHIGATDLLREMARRRAANPDWDDAAAIGHCVRIFRNNVAVWWEEVIPSDNSPRKLKEVTTSWEQFETFFRQAWIIEATLPAQSWWDNNPRRPNKSFAAFVTRVEDAVATTGREAIANTANHVKEEDEPPWTDRTGRGIAAQPACNPKSVAHQRPHKSITAFVTRVEIAVATKSREEISHRKNYVKEEDNPLWNDWTKKYIAAQAVFDARAVARPWTDVEKETIAARNQEYGREQQQAAMYECRHIMTNVVTFEIVRKGLSDPLMCTVATQIAGECTSTDIFKEKLTQIEKVNQTMPEPTKRASTAKMMRNFRRTERKKERKAAGNK
jgi:hypothetical protein